MSTAAVCSEVVFGWGENISGQLGDGTQAAREEPARVAELAGRRLRSLHCSRANSAATTTDGKVLVWGRAKDGLLGVPFGIAARVGSQPRELPFPESVEHFSLGDSHAALVTPRGQLYTWGVDLHGKLGLEQAVEALDLRRYDARSARDSGVVKTPTCSDFFGEGKILAARVVCKHNNTFVIDREGAAWAMGAGDRGMSGTGRARGDVERPERVRFGEETPLRDIRMGSNFTAALSSAGRVFAWGVNNYGQLGASENGVELLPVPVRLGADNELAQKIDCGEFHTVALSTRGELWSWGQGIHGQLGHGNKSDCPTPKKVATLSGLKDVAVGEAHTVALTLTGEVFVFGQGREGQMGQLSEAASSASYRTTPQRVEFFARNKLRVEQIAAGGNHCLAAVSSL